MSEEKIRRRIIEKCFKRTKFSMTEIEKLMCMYEAAVEEEGGAVDKMTRRQFTQFLHTHFNMTDQVLGDQIFKYFNEDHDSEITRSGSETEGRSLMILQGRVGTGLLCILER